MRRYDDPVEVVRGRVGDQEGPAQFVWRDRRWQVCEVISTWVETGAWWEHADVHALLGAGSEGSAGAASVASLLGEREMWRVEAARGRLGARGVFELGFGWASNEWRLLRCLD